MATAAAADGFVMPTPEEALKRTVQRCAEAGILLPTYEMMIDPRKVPQKVQDELRTIGLWDVNPRNLFRITWHNAPVEQGGAFVDLPTFIDLPASITGIKARLVMLVGKVCSFFPSFLFSSAAQ